jgi:hypothetical protein
MKKRTSYIKILAAATALAALNLPLQAVQIYTDATGEIGTGDFPNLDFVSTTVSNTPTELSFTLTLDADLAATNWGKYMIAFDTAPGGDTSGNAWNRPISDPEGINFWVGSWIDTPEGGVQLWSFNNGWNDIGGATIDVSALAAGQITYTMPLSSLALSIGDSFAFDVFSSGGGDTDSAIDSLANPSISVADWGNAYVINPTLSYTVVPEPSTYAFLLGIAGLGLAVWRRRR